MIVILIVSVFVILYFINYPITFTGGPAPAQNPKYLIVMRHGHRLDAVLDELKGKDGEKYQDLKKMGYKME